MTAPEQTLTHGEFAARARRQAPLDNVVTMVAPAARQVTVRKRRLGEWLRVNHRRAREIVIAFAGVAALDVAAFQWHELAGWVAAGIGIIVAEKLAFGAEDSAPGSHRAGAR